MKNTSGFTHWVIIILISIIAVGLVGAAWYYEANKTTSSVVTYSTKEECESKTGCQCDVLLCDIKCPKNFKEGWACSNVRTDTNQAANTNTSQTETECEQLENETKALIEKVQYCERDSDCIVDTSFQPRCPFGCFLIRNKSFDGNEDLLLIFEKIKKYNNSRCVKCMYKCLMPPEQEDVKCQNNKCTDTRY